MAEKDRGKKKTDSWMLILTILGVVVAAAAVLLEWEKTTIHLQTVSAGFLWTQHDEKHNGQFTFIFANTSDVPVTVRDERVRVIPEYREGKGPLPAPCRDGLTKIRDDDPDWTPNLIPKSIRKGDPAFVSMDVFVPPSCINTELFVAPEYKIRGALWLPVPSFVEHGAWVKISANGSNP